MSKMVNDETFEPQGFVLQGITITRRMLDDGTETYAVEYEGNVGWLEGLGLLEAAKFHHYEHCQSDWSGDD